MTRKFFSKFLRKEEGISALEYALIAALIALAIVVGAQTLGTSMNDKLAESATAVDNSQTP